MFHYAQLLRLGLAEELLPDGLTAVNSQAAQQHIVNAMQQEQQLELLLEKHPHMWITDVNVGVAECHILAGDTQRDGVWGTAAASLQEALQMYTKAACPSNDPAGQAAIARIKEMQGDLAAAQSGYRKAALQEYSLGELGSAKLLAPAVTANPLDVLAKADTQTALSAALHAAEHGLPRAKASAATLEEDNAKAAALLQEAVDEDGHPECLLTLAMGYAHGQYGLPRYVHAGAPWYLCDCCSASCSGWLRCVCSWCADKSCKICAAGDGLHAISGNTVGWQAGCSCRECHQFC
jgi:hypothetical protein